MCIHSCLTLFALSSKYQQHPLPEENIKTKGYFSLGYQCFWFSGAQDFEYKMLGDQGNNILYLKEFLYYLGSLEVSSKKATPKHSGLSKVKIYSNFT